MIGFFSSPPHSAGSGARPSSYPMGSGGYYLGGKAAGSWSWPLTYI